MLAPSNGLTYAAIACSLLAVWAAFVKHDPAIAGFAIAAAVIADTFDGAFARRFHRSPAATAFGAQLDSLADAVSSGVVPPLVLLGLTGGSAPMLWLATVVWVIAAVSRLAYYNITAPAADGFVGLPAPVAALVVATALLWLPGVAAATLLVLLLAVAMCSGVAIPRPRGRALLVFAAWPAVVMVLHALRLAG